MKQPEPSRHILETERLQDPLGDRQVPIEQCPLPPQKELSLERVYGWGDQLPDYELVKDYLFEQGKVAKELATKIVRDSALIFGKEPNLLRIEGRVTIVGDVHG